MLTEAKKIVEATFCPYISDFFPPNMEAIILRVADPGGDYPDPDPTLKNRARPYKFRFSLSSKLLKILTMYKY